MREWVKKEWQEDRPRAFCLGIAAIVAIAFIVHIGWAAVSTCLMISAGAIRNYIFALGGVAGVYGLSVATRRARTADDQLLNERLGRGTDLLAKDEMNMRRTGILVLEDLAKKSAAEDRKLIIQIIYDFIIANSQMKYAENEDGFYIEGDKGDPVLQEAKPREERFDIELAIKTVITLSESSDLRGDRIPFRKIDLRLLYFRRLETELRINFRESALNEVNFELAELNGAYFSRAELNKVNFRRAKLNRGRFFGAKLIRANFSRAELNEANFTIAELNRTRFIDAKLKGANFSRARLNGTRFKDADCSETNFKGVAEFTQDQVNQIIFEKGKEPILPEGLEIPENRAYVWQGDKKDRMKRRFVKSDAAWV